MTTNGFVQAVEVQPGDRLATHFGEPNADVLWRKVGDRGVILTIRLGHNDKVRVTQPEVLQDHPEGAA